MRWRLWICVELFGMCIADNQNEFRAYAQEPECQLELLKHRTIISTNFYGSKPLLLLVAWTARVRSELQYLESLQHVEIQEEKACRGKTGSMPLQRL